MQNRNAFLLYLGFVGLALAASAGSAQAATCTSTGTNQITCTGGQGASLSFTNGTAGVTKEATTYPATLAFTGAPAGSTVASVSVTLNGYTAAAAPTGSGSADVGVLLEGPISGSVKPNLQIMRWLGRGTNGQNNLTVIIQDGGAAIPGGDGNVNGWTAGGTFSPSVYNDTARDGEASPNYGVTIQHSAAPLGTSTLTSVFGGQPVNGNWNLYLADDGSNASISFNSWDLVINYSGASTPSSTTLSPSPATAFTSGMNSTITLTATVTAGATGTVAFQDGSTKLTCSAGNPVTLSGSAATCATTIATEGIHLLSATYSGDATFVTSAGTANVFLQNHASSVSTTYCNTGLISNNGSSNFAFSNTVPYPSVIFVGDGVNQDITNSVSTVNLVLKNLSSLGTNDMHMLLVSPDGAHAFDFWSNAGAGAMTTGDYTIVDGSSQLPEVSSLSPGTFGPTAYSLDNNNPLGDSFTPGPPTPAPQIPATFSVAAPAGSKTFLTAFNGATAHGAWSLYLYNGTGTGETTKATGGWCLDITPATGHATTTTVTSNPAPQAALGQSVTFTASIASSPAVGSVGTVTFSENGAPLVGAGGGGISSVVGGQASTSTTMLPEGDHVITAQFHDATNTFSDSFGTVSLRVDKATGTPTLTGTTWSYCNTGVITIPAGTVAINDLGPAQPNPSNIFVTNLPGTISSINLTMNGLHLAHGANDLESLLVGPNGGNPPGKPQTLDFFSLVGNNTAFSPETVTFQDLTAALTCSATSAGPAATDGPTSCAATAYTASPFFTLPNPIQHATPAGGFTFNTRTLTTSSGGVYLDTIPNGTWSLYFDQPQHDTGSGLNGGWCMNFTQNPVNVSATKSHTGPAPSNHFKQGSPGQFTISILNNGPGPTGDPDGNHPLTVTDTLAADFSVGTLPTGTPWNCTSAGQTVTCKSHGAVDAGSSYATLTIPVNVSSTAAATDNNSVSVSGGGVSNTVSNTDTVIIDPAPVLAILKSHTGTFTQGSTAAWTIQVSNNASSASGSTVGTVTVTDTLPAGYTLSSAAATNWTCSGTTTVTCTSTAVVAGAGGDFPLITLTVNVPAASATSVSNTASVFGGGDLNHATSGTALASNPNTVTVVQAPSTIGINGNATQSAAAGSAFGSLAVTLKDAAGAVIPNYSSVVFTATTGAGGQSGTFGNGTNTTSINTTTSGIADPGTFTANSKAGSYSVGVTAGSATATFNLTNTGTGPATVTSVSSTTANGAYGAGAGINVTVTFSKAVTVTGTPLIALNSGGTASYSGGSTASTALAFTYVVGAGQNSSHLDVTSTAALTLNGGAILDASSTPATLTLPAPGAAGSLGANSNIAIDTTSPTVVSYKVLWGSQSFNVIGTARNRLPWQISAVQVVFSKPIASGNVNSLSGVTTTGFSGLGTNTLTWNISPIALGNFATTLAGSGANALKDAAGNALAGGAGFTQNLKVLYGDFNDDGVVNSADMAAVQAAVANPYNFFADMNGDGVISAADTAIVRSRLGTSLP